MAVRSNDQYFEVEAQYADEDDGYEQVLVAARFVGGGRQYAGNAPVNQGHWPVRQTFLSGVWYFGFIAKRGYSWFDARAAWEITDDAETIAQLMVEKNGLPGNVFGDSPDIELQNRTADALGLEAPADAGATYTEQVRTLAGGTRADQLLDDHSADTLREAVKVVRDDADEFSLRGASAEDMAAWLAEQDAETVDAALDEVS